MGAEDGLIFFRHFHANPGLLARRRNEESYGLRTPKKEKFAKRESRTQPPVEAPYVPKVKIPIKSAPDKTVDIFEGMTIVELAKRTGKPISSLQDILVNVGEKVESEFIPLSIDIAELVAMVGSRLYCLFWDFSMVVNCFEVSGFWPELVGKIFWLFCFDDLLVTLL